MPHSAGLLGIADPIKPTTPDAVRRLKEDGLKLIMLTGDHQHTAQAIARQLDIDHVIAGVCRIKKGR